MVAKGPGDARGQPGGAAGRADGGGEEADRAGRVLQPCHSATRRREPCREKLEGPGVGFGGIGGSPNTEQVVLPDQPEERGSQPRPWDARTGRGSREVKKKLAGPVPCAAGTPTTQHCFPLRVTEKQNKTRKPKKLKVQREGGCLQARKGALTELSWRSLDLGLQPPELGEIKVCFTSQRERERNCSSADPELVSPSPSV